GAENAKSVGDLYMRDDGELLEGRLVLVHVQKHVPEPTQRRYLEARRVQNARSLALELDACLGLRGHATGLRFRSSLRQPHFGRRKVSLVTPRLVLGLHRRVRPEIDE